MIQIFRRQVSSGAEGVSARYLPPQTSMLDLEFAQMSDPGRVRPGNEDYLGYVAPATPQEAQTQGWLFAVADGVGGHEKGEVASATAVEVLLEGFRAAGKGEALTSLLTRLV